MRAGERNRLEGLVVSEGRFDAESLDFHERVRQGCRALAEEEPERFAIIDAAQPPEDVVLQCRSAIESHFAPARVGIGIVFCGGSHLPGLCNFASSACHAGFWRVPQPSKEICTRMLHS